jgi:hypothetical protein
MCARCSGHRGAVSLALRAPGSEIATLGDNDVRHWEAAAICYVLIGLGFGGAIGHGDGRLIAGLTLGTGSFTALMLAIAALGRPALGFRLAYGLIPLAGFGLFLGAIEHSLAMLASEGIRIEPAVSWLRAGTLTMGATWCGWLLLRLTAELPPLRRGFALAVGALTVGALCLFYHFAPAII